MAIWSFFLTTNRVGLEIDFSLVGFFLYDKILTITLIEKDTSVCNGTRESLQSLIT